MKKPPSIESGPERYPNEEAVAALFEKFTNGEAYKEIRKREDEHGYIYGTSRSQMNLEEYMNTLNMLYAERCVPKKEDPAKLPSM